MASGRFAVFNEITCEVKESAYTGVSDKYRLQTPEGLEVLARLPSGPGHRRYQPGDTVALGFAATDVRLIEVL